MDTSNRGRREAYEPSAIEEDYLKAIHEITRQAPERAARTGEVAGRLVVSPGTVTSMFRRLAHAGLLTHKFHHGVRLTARGRRLAIGVLRRHQVVETFLARVLEQSGLDMHMEAERLEHTVSEELVARMDQFLRRSQSAA